MAVDCWLAITENRTGPNAYKSQDVITAANGKTIQTIHTDAEGRMVLADTLTLASRDKPKLMIDYATLTGSVVNAITTRYSGVFTNRPTGIHDSRRTGQNCGERVWPFPIGKEFLDDLKSETADIMQCSPKAPATTFLPAAFWPSLSNTIRPGSTSTSLPAITKADSGTYRPKLPDSACVTR